jgi:hypothetical protein
MTGDSERILVGLSTGELVQFSWDATVSARGSASLQTLTLELLTGVAELEGGERGGEAAHCKQPLARHVGARGEVEVEFCEARQVAQVRLHCRVRPGECFPTGHSPSFMPQSYCSAFALPCPSRRNSPRLTAGMGDGVAVVMGSARRWRTRAAVWRQRSHRGRRRRKAVRRRRQQQQQQPPPPPPPRVRRWWRWRIARRWRPWPWCSRAATARCCARRRPPAGEVSSLG